MTLLGLLGRKRVGKDTVADHLVQEYGYQKISMADPLKDVLRVLFLFGDEQLYGDLKEVIDERWGISPRQALQFVGTNIFRDCLGGLIPGIGNDFWVRRCEYGLQGGIQYQDYGSVLKNILQILFLFRIDQLDGELFDQVDKRWNVKPCDVLGFMDGLLNEKLEELIDGYWKKRNGMPCWCDVPERQLDRGAIVVADVRFNNEADMVHRLGGIVVKVDRDIPKEDTHISESGIDAMTCYDILIQNNGSLEDLYEVVGEIV